MSRCGAVTTDGDDGYGGTCSQDRGHEGQHDCVHLDCIHGRDPWWRCEVCEATPKGESPDATEKAVGR